jgi:integrase
MASVKASYTLYQRERTKGKSVWYFQTYDENGKRLPGRSTGATVKSEARAYCERLLIAGKLAQGRAPTLAAWIAERHWYEWDREEPAPRCKYSLGRIARSEKERPAIGRGHIDRCRRFMEMYIVPRFGETRLDELRPADLEEWLFSLASKGLASKTVVNISSAFRTITAEAERLEIIGEDPWKRVPPFHPSSKPRGVLTIGEALVLLDPATWETTWKGGRLNYLISLAAAFTACRQGELLALRHENLFPDHLDIEASWTIRYHERGPTKTKRKAPVPIPTSLYKTLYEFAQWDGYIFSYTAGKAPATGARVADALYAALERIGIDDEARRARGIMFHSWRRFANSYMRGRGISDAKIRELTRHSSEKMTDHYTNWDPAAFADVVHEQELLANAIADPGARGLIIATKPAPSADDEAEND